MNTQGIDAELPPPAGYYYEWDGPYGKRKFTSAPHNGRECNRVVAYYTEDQVRAAIEADRKRRGDPDTEREKWLASLYPEDQMFEEIDQMARESYKRHMSLKRGQMVVRADAWDSHVIWATKRCIEANEPAPNPQPQQARPTDDDLWDKTLSERDYYHDMADKLAEAIAAHFGVDIGEHSSANCPWEVALDAIEAAPQPQQIPEGFCLDTGHRKRKHQTGEDCTCPKYVRHPECDRHEPRAYLPKTNPWNTTPEPKEKS